MTQFKHVAVAFSLVASLAGASVFAADTKSDTKAKRPEPTKEQREKMADLHEKMASCLKSDKTLQTCRDEMKTACEALGKDGCPMMMSHGQHDGHHGGHHDKSNG